MGHEEQKALRYNEGKLQWHLIHWQSMEPMVKVLEFGAKKYDPWNWQKGMPVSALLDSTMRHLLAISRGELLDPKSGLPHTGHIQSNIMFLEYNLSKYPDNFDLPCKPAVQIILQKGIMTNASVAKESVKPCSLKGVDFDAPLTDGTLSILGFSQTSKNVWESDSYPGVTLRRVSEYDLEITDGSRTLEGTTITVRKVFALLFAMYVHSDTLNSLSPITSQDTHIEIRGGRVNIIHLSPVGLLHSHLVSTLNFTYDSQKKIYTRDGLKIYDINRIAGMFSMDVYGEHLITSDYELYKILFEENIKRI